MNDNHVTLITDIYNRKTGRTTRMVEAAKKMDCKIFVIAHTMRYAKALAHRIGKHAVPIPITYLEKLRGTMEPIFVDHHVWDWLWSYESIRK